MNRNTYRKYSASKMILKLMMLSFENKSLKNDKDKNI